MRKINRQQDENENFNEEEENYFEIMSENGLTVDQLKTRLRLMNVEFSLHKHPKSHFLSLYQEAIKDKSKRELLKKGLQEDQISQKSPAHSKRKSPAILIKNKRKRSEDQKQDSDKKQAIKTSSGKIENDNEDVVTESKISIKTVKIQNLNNSNDYSTVNNLSNPGSVKSLVKAVRYFDVSRQASETNNINNYYPEATSDIHTQSEEQGKCLNENLNRNEDFVNNNRLVHLNSLSSEGIKYATPYQVTKTYSSQSLPEDLQFKSPFSYSQFKKEYNTAMSLQNLKHSRSHVIDSIKRTRLEDFSNFTEFAQGENISSKNNYFSEDFLKIFTGQFYISNFFQNNSVMIKKIGKNIAILCILSAVGYFLFPVIMDILKNKNFADFDLFLNSRTLLFISFAAVIAITIAYFEDKIRNYVDRESKLIADNSVAEVKRFLIGNNEKILYEEKFIEEYCQSNNYKEKDFRKHILPFIKNLVKDDEEIEETLSNIDGSAKVIWRCNQKI